MRVPKVMGVRHVDKAHARPEGSEQMRANRQLGRPGDVREEREGAKHREEVDLVARGRIGILGRGYVREQVGQALEDKEREDDAERGRGRSEQPEEAKEAEEAQIETRRKGLQTHTHTCILSPKPGGRAEGTWDI